MNQQKQSLRALALMTIGLCLQAYSETKTDSKNSTHDQAAALDTVEQKISYLMGFSVAQQLSESGVIPDQDALLAAIDDVAKGKQTRMDERQTQLALRSMQIRTHEKKLLKQKQAVTEQGLSFLEKNKNAQGVTTLESGVQYSVISPGEGEYINTEGLIRVHYKASLLDGTSFENTYADGMPVSFLLVEAIEGWREVLPKMRVGATWRVWVPPHLAYPNGTIDIPAGSTLVYELEVMSVE